MIHTTTTNDSTSIPPPPISIASLLSSSSSSSKNIIHQHHQESNNNNSPPPPPPIRLAALAALKAIDNNLFTTTTTPPSSNNDIDIWTPILQSHRINGAYSFIDLPIIPALDVTPSLLNTSFTRPFVVTDQPSLLGLHIPTNLDIDTIVNEIGGQTKVSVIWVKNQTDIEFSLTEWQSYYQSKPRSLILNLLSLEISQSKLGKSISRPFAVKCVDLVEQHWPKSRQMEGDLPHIQLYCLMGTAGSYTDFHIDFGGTSVFYHIVSGEKVFFLIAPTPQNLKLYNEWVFEDTATRTHLALKVAPGECLEAHAVAGQTLFIPSGWIHAVFTPIDSIVIGGNFLSVRFMEMQIKIHLLELGQEIDPKFRLPNFSDIMWYTLSAYADADATDYMDVKLAYELFHLCTFLAQHPMKKINSYHNQNYPLPPLDIPNTSKEPYQILYSVTQSTFHILRALKPTHAEKLNDLYLTILFVCQKNNGTTGSSLKCLTEQLALATGPLHNRAFSATNRMSFLAMKRRRQ